MTRRTVVAVAAAALAGAIFASSATAGTGRFAWFYKPPTDGTSAATVAAKHEALILSYGDEWFRSEVRAAGYAGPIHQYITLAQVHGPAGTSPGSACDASFAPWRNQVAWFRGDFCRHVHPNEDWFLHNSRGQRLYMSASSGAYYAMNPASPGWRSFFEARVRQAFAGDATAGPFGYDALFLDEIWGTLHMLKNKMANSDGAVREFSSDTAYEATMKEMLDHARAAAGTLGIEVWGNAAPLLTTGAFRAHLDGQMVEDFATSWGGSYMSEDTVKRVWSHVDADAAASKPTLLVGQGRQADALRARYAYAAYLMVTQPNVYFRYQSADDYRALWWYDDFDRDLGAPTSARYQLTSSIWARDFERGVALVNLSSSATQTATLARDVVPDGGTPTSSVTLGPKGAALLAWAVPPEPPTAPPVNVAPPTIDGATHVGGRLVATRGTWEQAPWSFVFEWQRCDAVGEQCVTVSTGLSRRLTLKAADLGSTIRVVVTATNSLGSTAAASSATAAVVPAPRRKPRVRLFSDGRIGAGTGYTVTRRVRGHVVLPRGREWQIRWASRHRKAVKIMRKRVGTNDWRRVARIRTRADGRFRVPPHARRHYGHDFRLRAVARYNGVKTLRSRPITVRR